MRIFFLSLWLIVAGSSVAAGPCAPDRLALKGDWGGAVFSVEIAKTNATREKGLMFRKSLPRFSGMLFIYESPQRAMFWMKNTLIPLDMLFIDKHGTVRRIHQNAVPRDLSVINGGRNIYAVLEINGGLAARLGVTIGTRVQSPFFTEQPVWPCP